jgi:hypothetical protein
MAHIRFEIIIERDARYKSSVFPIQQTLHRLPSLTKHLDLRVIP